jgi:hypothetical protein
MPSRLRVAQVLIVLMAPFAATSGPVSGQSDTLKTYLAARLQETYVRDPGHVLELVWPGLALPDVKGVPDAEDQFEMATLVNAAPLRQPFYAAGSATVRGLYSHVVNNKIVEVLPHTAAETQQLEAAHAVFFDPKTRKNTPRWEAYLEQEAIYLQRLDDIANQTFELREAGTFTGSHEAKFTAETKQAYDVWMAKGYKKEIEDALAVIDRLSNRDGLAWWHDVRADFDARQAKGPRGEVYGETDYHPHMSEWLKPAGWTQFRLNSTVASVRPPGRVAPGAPRTPVVLSAGTSQITNFMLSVELKRIEVDRPWLERQVFSNPHWTLRGVTAIDSEGLTITANAAKADLPLLITGLILARNAKFVMRVVDAQRFTSNPALAKGFLQMNGQSIWKRLTIKPVIRPESATTEDVEIKGPQIIGFICAKVPKSPMKSGR